MTSFLYFFYLSVLLTSAVYFVSPFHWALGLFGLQRLSRLGTQRDSGQGHNWRKKMRKTIYNHIRMERLPSPKSHERQFLFISISLPAPAFCLLLPLRLPLCLFLVIKLKAEPDSESHLEFEVLASYQNDNKISPRFLFLQLLNLGNETTHELSQNTHNIPLIHTNIPSSAHTHKHRDTKAFTRKETDVFEIKNHIL